MNTHSNKEIHRHSSERGKGLVGTTLIHAVLVILLVLLSFSVPPPPETEEGIMVNFGTDETGMGLIEPSPPPPAATTPPPRSKAVKQAEEEPLLTQNTEEAPAVKAVDPEIKRKKLEKIEADKKIREQENAERIIKQQEEIERKKVEAEQQRQSDIMNRTKNALANSKNAGTSSTGEGIAGGPGNQGDPNGSVDSKVRGHGSGTGTSGTGNGISYSIGGRRFTKLPPPKYDYQGEGIVVVEVTVDRTGKVIQALPGIKGSSTLDDYLLKVAKDAAMEARFDSKPDAPPIQKGTITYNFKLK